MKKNSITKYGFLWVTLILFLGSFLGHWTFSWLTYKDEQKEKHQPVVVNEYLKEVTRDTFENWQSEFLQLIWQVAGLTYLYYVGSPSSKEGDERKEEKIDYIIKALKGEDGVQEIRRLEKEYPKK